MCSSDLMDAGNDLASCIGLAAIGLALLASGVSAMNRRPGV